MEFEVFDCFGETFECSICQEPIQEGQRTLVLPVCQHGFHEPCIQPWITSHSTCPNCRTPFARPVARGFDEIAAALERRDVQYRELDRLYVSYILIDWVLRKYSGHATDLRRDYRTVTQLFHSSFSDVTDGIRPIPIERITLSNLGIMKQYVLRRETELYGQAYPNQSHLAIHRCPRLRELRERLLPRVEAMFRPS